MRILVLGGIRSGKSQWAEATLAEAVGDAPVCYLATGPDPGADDDWAARVSAHRRRRPAHWTTCETVEVAAQLRTAPELPTLVDDVGGWLTATLDRRDGWSGASVADEVDDLVAAVTAFRSTVVLVSPEVGLSVVPASAAGRRFADELGTVNQRLARVCDRVVLMVAGLPVEVKEPV
ncbi:bifunctional adenosylcobinamide kinase/adenosylcobinamide-phosphate guanylyltransferase [Mycolicibacterium thermoresistibile]